MPVEKAPVEGGAPWPAGSSTALLPTGCGGGRKREDSTPSLPEYKANPISNPKNWDPPKPPPFKEGTFRPSLTQATEPLSYSRKASPRYFSNVSSGSLRNHGGLPLGPLLGRVASSHGQPACRPDLHFFKAGPVLSFCMLLPRA